MKQFSQIKVIQMYDGYWAVIREIKGVQPQIIARYKRKEEATRRKKEITPKKRPRRAVSTEPLGYPYN